MNVSNIKEDFEIIAICNYNVFYFEPIILLWVVFIILIIIIKTHYK